MSATDEPEIPPKNILAKTFTCAKPPRTFPTKELENLIRRWLIPPSPMISPAKMKKGIANNEKELIPLTIP